MQLDKREISKNVRKLKASLYGSIVSEELKGIEWKSIKNKRMQ